MISSLEIILEVSLIFFSAYLLVAVPPLVDVVLHYILKIIYNKTRDEIFKILINRTSSNNFTSILRYSLLFAYISLPLYVIFVSTMLSVEYIFNRSSIFTVFGIIITFLLLYVILLLSRFTIIKYGAIYKLPFLSLIRKDIRQFLEEHDDIQSILALGSFLFSVTIIALFLGLANAYTSLSKDVIFFVLAVLLIEVIFNERYDNALKLIERTLTSSRPGGHGFSSP